MRVLILSLVPLGSLAVSARVQADAVPTAVTLYSVQGHHLVGDWTRATISFEPSEETARDARESRHHFDLVYGDLTIGRGRDWYRDWLRVGNPRSIIADLGEEKWADVRGTPTFPQGKWRQPLPLTAPIVLNASGGRKADAVDATKAMSPYRQYVIARAGHMYLMKVVNGHRPIYVMFRVESLTTRDRCVLSWKRVTPPEEDEENER